MQAAAQASKHDCIEHLYLIVPVQNIFACCVCGSDFAGYRDADGGWKYDRLNGKRRLA